MESIEERKPYRLKGSVNGLILHKDKLFFSFDLFKILNDLALLQNWFFLAGLR